MTMRFSLRFNNDLPVHAYPPLARAAEAAGFDQFWISDDLLLRGVWPILSACALATERIQLGTCIVNPYTTHPAEIAMQAAALDELSHGRALLGVGAGASEFLNWVGVPAARQLTRTAETLLALRGLLAGERVAQDFSELGRWTPEAYLRFPSRAIPLYLGATSPKMTALIGRMADGGLPLLFPPEQYATVAAQVAAGAADAGRNLNEIDLAACIWVSIDADRQRATAVLRDKVAYYAGALSDTILANLNTSRAEAEAISRAVQRDGDMAAARALVSDDLLRIGVVGAAGDVRRRLEPLVAAGARHLSFGPPLGPDPLAAIALLGRAVLPGLR